MPGVTPYDRRAYVVTIPSAIAGPVAKSSGGRSNGVVVWSRPSYDTIENGQQACGVECPTLSKRPAANVAHSA